MPTFVLMAKQASDNWDKDTAMARASAFCAYQERSQQEVRSKLLGIGVGKELAEEVIAELIGLDFLNEERFALAYAGGKFRMKGWGKLRIRQGLQAKGVSEPCIWRALEAIDPDDYLEKLRSVLEKKAAGLSEKDIFRKKNKVARYAISRGYEPGLVWETLRETDLK